jgi:RNA-binding protein PNO1
MPAPTALVQPVAAPETALVPAPEQDDELLLDIQDANAVDPSAVAPPATGEDTDMVVDEEGRPRFAPGKDIVRLSGQFTEEDFH